MKSDVERLMATASQRRFAMWQCVGAVLVFMGVAAVCELMMDRQAISQTWGIFFWTSERSGQRTSQGFFDWYSFSHVTHGLIFLLVLRWLGRGKLPLPALLVIAVAIEAGWEILENSPFVIERYRHTMAAGYDGDTVLNSMCDIACCIVGFVIASRVPAWVAAAIIVGVELFMLAAIRDNLTLNVLMLIHPFDAIRQWQMGG